jgi:leucyl-tRNA synthetase
MVCSGTSVPHSSMINAWSLIFICYFFFKVTKAGDHYVLKDDLNIHVDARAYKMSKSRGNVINPDDVVSEYGADSLRLYEMFMGPLRFAIFHQILYDSATVSGKETERIFDTYRDSKTWSTGGIEGVHRFLGRTWRLIVGPPLSDGSYKDGTTTTKDEPTMDQLRVLHRCIARVGHNFQVELFSFTHALRNVNHAKC